MIGLVGRCNAKAERVRARVAGWGEKGADAISELRRGAVSQEATASRGHYHCTRDHPVIRRKGETLTCWTPPSAVYLTSKWSTRGMSSPTLLAPRGSTCEVRCLLYRTPSETRVGRNEGLWGPGQAGAPWQERWKPRWRPDASQGREALGGTVAAAVAGEDLHEQVGSTQERGKAKQI